MKVRFKIVCHVERFIQNNKDLQSILVSMQIVSWAYSSDRRHTIIYLT
jgi:hypothetical protein